MSHYKYLIIGAGMTADAAVSAIRRLDTHGSIGLISTELVPPYDRPPLSKGLWKGKTIESIWRNTESLDVKFHFGRTIQSLDARGKHVTDDEGQVYSFDKLLLATGGAPRQLPFGMGQIIYFRTLQDYQRLRALAEKGKRFAVIGGGFIGSEIAAALAINGKEVVMIFPDEVIGARMFPHDLGLFLNEYFRKFDNETGFMIDGFEILKYAKFLDDISPEWYSCATMNKVSAFCLGTMTMTTTTTPKIFGGALVLVQG